VIPADYFDRSGTSAKDSPVARIMRQLNVLYAELPAADLRALANKRIHTGGQANVKWSREEARRLKDAGVLPGSKQGERFIEELICFQRAIGWAWATIAARPLTSQTIRRTGKNTWASTKLSRKALA
jgi:hypothetical protein